jgi:KDO2-lipid IV(A) lauroyltransferase
MGLTVYHIVKIASSVLMCLPSGVALGIGRFVGLMGYYLSLRRKRIAYNNLRTAFCALKSDREIRRILKKCYKNFGQNIVELLRLPLVTKTGFRPMVSLEGEEHIKEALSRGKGVIFLAVHSGNWELSNIVGSMLGYPYNLIANPQEKAGLLDKLLTSYRMASGCKIINPGDGTREIIRRLKNNEIVTLVADQGGQDGELVDFFGRKASMSTGAVRLALKHGAAICLVDISRNDNGTHRLLVDRPLELIRTDEGDDADLMVNLEAIIKSFEYKINEHPHEYMWFYKIWKYSKSANIVILNDGRTGHLRQSQALAAIMTQALAKKEKTVSVATVDMRLRKRRLLALTAFFGQWFSDLRSPGMLKIVLEKASFDQLITLKADYIISCGSAGARVNFMASPWQCAKSISILKPDPLTLNRFDLVVLPAHDSSKITSPKAVVAVTRTALNLIDNEYMDRHKQLLLNRFSHLKNSYRIKIGVLIGGNTKNIEFTESAIKMVIHQVKEVALQLNADIILTTSRRTPENVEQILWRELKKFERCSLLISAANSDVPEAVGGILGLSDYLLVSGESISMVSEAVSSGKKTVVFNVTSSGDAERNKYERFVDTLSEQGHVVVCPIKGISKALYNVVSDKIHLKSINDRESIARVVDRII